MKSHLGCHLIFLGQSRGLRRLFEMREVAGGVPQGRWCYGRAHFHRSGCGKPLTRRSEMGRAVIVVGVIRVDVDATAPT
jgi:hypothetical protein